VTFLLNANRKFFQSCQYKVEIPPFSFKLRRYITKINKKLDRLVILQKAGIPRAPLLVESLIGKLKKKPDFPLE